MQNRTSRVIQWTVLALVSFAAPAVQSQTETILYSFTGGNDGGSPQGNLILDGKGNLYGTTEGGGSNSGGTVFELTPNSNGTWSENVLYNFEGFFNTGDGYFPAQGLVMDGNGNLYGTTTAGGTSFQGTVFELSPGTNGVWTEKVLYNFAGGTDGSYPLGSGLFLDSHGNLYGTTNNGGACGFGTIFELVAGANGTWTKKVLHSFTGGNDGSYPYGLLLVRDGMLYGSSSNGGFHDYGVVFRLTEDSTGNWSETVLFSFTGVNGTLSPIGALAVDGKGNIYGTAINAFQLSLRPNGTWTEKDLHFFAGGSDGAYPDSGLVIGANGALFGTTNLGGAHRGTIYEMKPDADGNWSEKVLHRFSSTGGDGIFPYLPSLAIDAKGNLYGITSGGGSSGFGVVYEITP